MDDRIEAWKKVFDLCISLGMITNRMTGEQAVLTFIKELSANQKRCYLCGATDFLNIVCDNCEAAQQADKPLALCPAVHKMA